MNKISVDEWLEAEREIAENRDGPRPEGYITAAEYGQMKTPGISADQARKRLSAMVNAGFATSAKWKVGRNYLNVYYLKPKKDWPKSKSSCKRA